MPDDEIKKILNLINNCTKAKSKKNYCVADEILEELKVVCGLRIDDAKKAWFFLPKFDDDQDKFDDGASNRKQKQGQRAYQNIGRAK